MKKQEKTRHTRGRGKRMLVRINVSKHLALRGESARLLRGARCVDFVLTAVHHSLGCVTSGIQTWRQTRLEDPTAVGVAVRCRASAGDAKGARLCEARREWGLRWREHHRGPGWRGALARQDWLPDRSGSGSIVGLGRTRCSRCSR